MNRILVIEYFGTAIFDAISNRTLIYVVLKMILKFSLSQYLSAESEIFKISIFVQSLVLTKQNCLSQYTVKLFKTRLKSNSVLDRKPTLLFLQDFFKTFKTFKISRLSRLSRLSMLSRLSKLSRLSRLSRL